MAVCAISLVGAGCGNSSNSSSKAASAPKPLTKAQYERQLGPLLNGVVDPALRAAFSNGAITPQKLTAAITVIRLAHDKMAAVTPPPAVSGLHKQAVTLLGSMVNDLTKLRTATVKGDRSGQSSAASGLIADARRMQTLGSEFTSRGY